MQLVLALHEEGSCQGKEIYVPIGKVNSLVSQVGTEMNGLAGRPGTRRSEEKACEWSYES